MPTPQTTYRIEYSETLTVETTSARVAELESRDGFRVTAQTGASA
jgi:hypothetical protein